MMTFGNQISKQFQRVNTQGGQSAKNERRQNTAVFKCNTVVLLLKILPEDNVYTKLGKFGQLDILVVLSL